MSYKISSADEYKLNFEQNDVVQSVLQNVSLILNTKKGTVPMHREFGLPMEFIDKPIDVAEALATTEIAQALEEFEPRAVLDNISFEKTETGQMAIVVEVSISDEQTD